MYGNITAWNSARQKTSKYVERYRITKQIGMGELESDYTALLFNDLGAAKDYVYVLTGIDKWVAVHRGAYTDYRTLYKGMIIIIRSVWIDNPLYKDKT